MMRQSHAFSLYVAFMLLFYFSLHLKLLCKQFSRAGVLKAITRLGTGLEYCYWEVVSGIFCSSFITLIHNILGRHHKLMGKLLYFLFELVKAVANGDCKWLGSFKLMWLILMVNISQFRVKNWKHLFFRQ